MVEELQKLKTLSCTISALIIGIGLYFSPDMLQRTSWASSTSVIPGNLSGSSAPARITPEIKDVLERNNFRPAQYKNLAPDFELQNLNGEPVRLSQFRGEIVLLGFFTTW